MPEDGSAPELATDLRVFLGNLAGPPPAPAHAPTGPSQTTFTMPPLSAAGMQPIKIGLGKKIKLDVDGLIPMEVKNVLGDDDEVDGVDRDSVLLSRSESLCYILL